MCDKRPSVCGWTACFRSIRIYGGDDPKLFKLGTFEAAANQVTTRGHANNAHVARRSAHRYASLVSTCGSSSGSSRAIVGYGVGLVTANRGQWASPDEFSITVGGRYVREKNQEFSLPNRTIVIRASKLGGFCENREGWQPWYS